MKADTIEQRVKEILENAPADKKAEAIYEAANLIAEERYKEVIERTKEEAKEAEANEEFRKGLKLRKLSQEEEKFYEKLRDPKQAITAAQIDIIPTSIVDITLESIKETSDTLSLVNFAPADVKKWISAEKTGTAAWGEPTDEVKGELNATITSMNMDEKKLTAYLVIPKAIRELALPFVDKYFRAILGEVMHDGLVEGYLTGNGKTGPIGIMNKIDSFTSSGTAAAKTVLATVKRFSPKGLAEVRKTLTNNGKRRVTELHLICNPLDEAEYVDPCMYGEAPSGGYRDVSFMKIIKHPEPMCPEGKAIFTIKGKYTMGMMNPRVDEYDQTKAMDDADVIIAKAYANGRAVDDNVAVVFDVTKLEEYVLPITQVTMPQTV